MGNPYFHFKQFTIYHDRCAMKVGTDGVLLGAWVDLSNVQRALDIGTGSGLIAMMMAQRAEASIDAIEIDPEAADQARSNVQNGPWPTRIHVHQTSLQSFVESIDTTYDLLISNPPFFRASTRPHQARRGQARHDDSLPPDDLLHAAEKCLHETGSLAVIYPVSEAQDFHVQAHERGFRCHRALAVAGREGKAPKRVLSQWSRLPSDATCNQPTLPLNALPVMALEKNLERDFTDEYAELARDFYLRL
jgi:tRNA1Val (adenine37-N6)-methyltransferase